MNPTMYITLGIWLTTAAVYLEQGFTPALLAMGIQVTAAGCLHYAITR